MNARPPEMPPHKLISSLRGFNLLPAIIFLPTRRKCDEAASEVAGDKSQRVDSEKQAARKRLFEEFRIANPEIARHKHRRGVASCGAHPVVETRRRKDDVGGTAQRDLCDIHRCRGCRFPCTHGRHQQR
jgi:hypothetical protein